MVFRLFSLLQSIGRLRDMLPTEAVNVFNQVVAALSQLWEARTLEDYFQITIDVLRPIVKATTNTFDDGALAALEALKTNPDFMSWLEEVLPTTAAMETAIPEGALPVMDRPAVPLPGHLLPVQGPARAGFLELLPILLAILKLLRGQ